MIEFNNSYAKLPAHFYEKVLPSPAPSPSIVRVNSGLCEELGMDASWLESAEGLAMLAGNSVPAGADPIAMGYAGHQFGNWNPQLGDGRAILLGEVVDRNDANRDIHLKGAGRTPYSRGGDGKATLGSVIREYILSEAMHALGIPTTRALAVITTGESVYREGRMPGAILARVAHSHVRVGTFQWFSSRGDDKAVQTLADYMVQRHFSDAQSATHPYAAMLDEVVSRHAQLVAKWMQVGFIHGVMNTDNSQVVGETIDYGPCAFMDDFHPQCVFSSIDHQGRYAWGNQPTIAQWNLQRFAETLLPLLAPTEEEAIEVATVALKQFPDHFDSAFVRGFSTKLGLATTSDNLDAERDFIATTFSALATNEVDFTLFFRHLTRVASGDDSETLVDLFEDGDAAKTWMAAWQKRFRGDLEEERVAAMRSSNPVFIARNHRVEQAIAASLEGDLAPFHELVALLANPFDEQPENASYEQAPKPGERVLETFCGT